MSNSILTDTKKLLGVAESYTAFDTDIVTHINSVFMTLTQLGVGPSYGYVIEDATATWDSLIGLNISLTSVKSYIYAKVRLLFDPPDTSHHMVALKEVIQELEWRIAHQVEHGEQTELSVNPTTAPDQNPYDGFVDGQSFEAIYQNAKV